MGAEENDYGNSEEIIWNLTILFFSPLQFSSARAFEQKRLFLDKDGELKVSNGWIRPRGLRLCCGICNGFSVCPEIGRAQAVQSSSANAVLLPIGSSSLNNGAAYGAKISSWRVQGLAGG